MTRTLYTPNYKFFLKRLRTARKHANLTQEQVSKIINKPQSFVSKSESGERRIDAMEAAEFARVYKTSLEHLIKGDEQS